ncbi:olfactory receptor 12-like [Mauremys reevesii]|uniref:olfactory receptor 12-like n=1 Tax=Mauremys reevesii TaxID=260615 RepID=UPI00193EC631|nr:olfactory receptor 12-like [Mauremys reevesii]
METTREDNCTALTEFILLGLGSGPAPHIVPFLVFLVIYMTTVLGNTSMILLIRANSHLHTPMYLFLINLSVLDLCFTSIVAPKAMASLLAGSKAISYNGCATLLFFFSVFLTAEGFLLAAMAWDRYIIICNPLLYPITMSKWVCVQLVAGSYFGGCVNSMVQTGFTFTLYYCGSNEIDRFFCDGPPLNLVMFTLCSLIIGSTSLFVLISYAYIISTILRIRSAEGRHKAFSTCTSHIIAVSLFYGSTAFMYSQPTWLTSLYPRKAVSVFTPCHPHDESPHLQCKEQRGERSLGKNYGEEIFEKLSLGYEHRDQICL